MKSLTSFIILIIFFGLLHPYAIFSAEADVKDAYQAIKYRNAFDQEAIYKANASLLKALGCDRNVFSDQSIRVHPSAVNDVEGQVAINIDDQGPLLARSRFGRNELGNQVVTDQALKKFEQDCLQPLYKARFMALAQPGLDAIQNVALTGSAAIATQYVPGASQMGGFWVGAAVQHAFDKMPKMLSTGRNIWSRPDNVLESLEDQFAKNKCYIPKALWPKIMQSFVAARQSEFSRDKHTNFLNNALYFTIYKPKAAIKFKGNMSLEDVKNEINARIETFFAEYATDDMGYTIGYIKINVFKFIDSLIGSKAQAAPLQAPRYLYLYGLGGIGKTYFVQKLANWIDELIPGSVCFEELVIDSADKLEGTSDSPGAMLKVLRNQLMQNKRGSIIMIDEATWLNEPSMVSAAKRVFNGDQSKLSTSYFGTEIDGSSITLKIPPMLIVVASNESIKDKALESRFDVINYPVPLEQALIDYAVERAHNSEELREHRVTVRPEDIVLWVKHLDPSNKNFRYVAGNVEVELLAAKTSQARSKKRN
jgi:hypothetical protein